MSQDFCNNFIKISEITELCRENCRIKNSEKVENILNELLKGGVRKLQVITDFDHTITKFYLEDRSKKVPTSFGMFKQCKSIPKSIFDSYVEVIENFRSIMRDRSLSTEQRNQNLIEFWSIASDLMSGFPLDPNEIDEIAHKYCDSLRDGTQELFQDLNKLNVPLLVFSAGLGDCVVSVLKQSKILLPNVKVISNFLRYGKDNVLEGLNEPIIHTFNKNETVLKGTEYYNIVRDRDHVIVMGDSLGDAGMATGVPSSLNVLKIGFLFDHVEQNLSKYMDSFDIVLVDDQTMDVPRAILSLIEQNSQ